MVVAAQERPDQAQYEVDTVRAAAIEAGSDAYTTTLFDDLQQAETSDAEVYHGLGRVRRGDRVTGR